MIRKGAIQSRLVSAFVVGCAVLGGACLVACSGSVASGSAPAAAPDAGPVGSISAEFQLPSGSASTANYTLTGPNGFSLAAMLDFAGSQAIGFIITSVPAGPGYMLSFTATDGDGGESCMGSTTVDVVANKTATVNVEASCTGGPYVPIGYGLIDAWVTTPPQVSLSSASFSLTGPAGVEANQSLTVSGSASVHFGLKQVPAGDGQVLAITATTTTGQKCEASAAINVDVNATAEAMLNLTCQ
jgi:hypothetical protein